MTKGVPVKCIFFICLYPIHHLLLEHRPGLFLSTTSLYHLSKYYTYFYTPNALDVT